MRTYTIEAKTRKEKPKNLSLMDEYRVRFLEGLPTKRIERRLLKVCELNLAIEAEITNSTHCMR